MNSRGRRDAARGHEPRGEAMRLCGHGLTQKLMRFRGHGPPRGKADAARGHDPAAKRRGSRLWTPRGEAMRPAVMDSRVEAIRPAVMDSRGEAMRLAAMNSRASKRYGSRPWTPASKRYGSRISAAVRKMAKYLPPPLRGYIPYSFFFVNPSVPSFLFQPFRFFHGFSALSMARFFRADRLEPFRFTMGF